MTLLKFDNDFKHTTPIYQTRTNGHGEWNSWWPFHQNWNSKTNEYETAPSQFYKQNGPRDTNTPPQGQPQQDYQFLPQTGKTGYNNQDGKYLCVILLVDIEVSVVLNHTHLNIK